MYSISTAPGTNRRKKKTEDYGEKKHKFILQVKLAVFLSGKFFCKIDLGLDTISFLERLLKVCDSQNSQFFDP